MGSAGKRFTRGGTNFLPLIMLDNSVALTDKEKAVWRSRPAPGSNNIKQQDKEITYIPKINQGHEELENFPLYEINPPKFRN
jgi:hypothetical protein